VCRSVPYRKLRSPFSSSPCSLSCCPSVLLFCPFLYLWANLLACGQAEGLRRRQRAKDPSVHLSWTAGAAATRPDIGNHFSGLCCLNYFCFLQFLCLTSNRFLSPFTPSSQHTSSQPSFPQRLPDSVFFLFIAFFSCVSSAFLKDPVRLLD